MYPNSLNECILRITHYQPISSETHKKFSKYLDDHKYYMGLQHHRNFTWSEVYTNFMEYFVEPLSSAMNKTKLVLETQTPWESSFIQVVEFREGLQKIKKDITPLEVCRAFIWNSHCSTLRGQINPLDKFFNWIYSLSLSKEIRNSIKEKNNGNFN